MPLRPGIRPGRADKRRAAPTLRGNAPGDLLPRIGYDNHQLACTRTVHDLIQYNRSGRSRRQAVQHRVYIAEHRPAEQDHHSITCQHHRAYRQVRPQRLDGHHQQVHAARGRAAHIEQRHPCAEEHARVQRCKERLARIGGQPRENHIKEQHTEHHTPQRPAQEPPPDKPVAEHKQRQVEQQRPQPDRHPQQLAEQQRQPGHAARRESRVLCKYIDAHRVAYAARQIGGNIPAPAAALRFSHSASLPLREPAGLRQFAGAPQG